MRNMAGIGVMLMLVLGYVGSTAGASDGVVIEPPSPAPTESRTALCVHGSYRKEDNTYIHDAIKSFVLHPLKADLFIAVTSDNTDMQEALAVMTHQYPEAKKVQWGVDCASVVVEEYEYVMEWPMHMRPFEIFPKDTLTPLLRGQELLPLVGEGWRLRKGAGGGNTGRMELAACMTEDEGACTSPAELGLALRRVRNLIEEEPQLCTKVTEDAKLDMECSEGRETEVDRPCWVLEKCQTELALRRVEASSNQVVVHATLDTSARKKALLHVVEGEQDWLKQWDYDLILVSPTYPGKEQLFRLCRMTQHLREAGKALWIVSDDTATPTEEAVTMLKDSGVHHMYVYGMQTKKHGNMQRRMALELVKQWKLSGGLYFADDDNAYHPALWAALRSRAPGQFGLIACSNRVDSPDFLTREGPLFNAAGKVHGWEHQIKEFADRPFPVDMGMFVYDASLVWGLNDPVWDYDSRGGETEYLQRLLPPAEYLNQGFNKKRGVQYNSSARNFSLGTKWACVSDPICESFPLMAHNAYFLPEASRTLSAECLSYPQPDLQDVAKLSQRRAEQQGAGYGGYSGYGYNFNNDLDLFSYFADQRYGQAVLEVLDAQVGEDRERVTLPIGYPLLPSTSSEIDNVVSTFGNLPGVYMYRQGSQLHMSIFLEPFRRILDTYNSVYLGIQHLAP
eukprot:Hpha_TRINITY_DN16745_c0_g1::TRINITY_DN16745_c0_g1_i1::g.77593::m.77593